MKLYEQNLTDFQDVEIDVIKNGLADGTIEVKGRVKEHHVVPESEKRPAKSAEQIYNELQEQGVPVEIHNGIYCKVVYGTFEAINAIPVIDDWDEYEELFVRK